MIRNSNGATRAAIAALAAAGILASPTASAGTKVNVPVVVDLANSTARGALGQTFNTTNRTENIGCYIYYWLEDSIYAVCEAYDSAGVRGSCITSEESFLNSIRSLNGDSVLTFSWVTIAPTLRECTMIQVDTSSATTPKR